MIFIRFLAEPDGALRGFEISGHADHAPYGEDTVCAAVSSAAYLVANTITEILKIPAEITVEQGTMIVQIAASDAYACRDILAGLKLHFTALEEQYPACMQVDYMEV